MCIKCGDFLFCGPCITVPCFPKLERSMDASNSPTMSVVPVYQMTFTPASTCKTCSPQNRKVVTCLLYEQLMLTAQLQLNLTIPKTSSDIVPSRKRAQKEYLRLADEENYALAQFAVGTILPKEKYGTDPCLWDMRCHLTRTLQEGWT